jgi:hypothetical protein
MDRLLVQEIREENCEHVQNVGYAHFPHFTVCEFASQCGLDVLYSMFELMCYFLLSWLSCAEL